MRLLSMVHVLGALVLASRAAAAPPKLPSRIEIDIKTDYAIKYVVSNRDAEGDDAPPAGRVRPRSTRVPATLRVKVVYTDGTSVRRVLHGLSTAHLPCCGSCAEETIEGLVGEVEKTCQTDDSQLASAFRYHFQAGGMYWTRELKLPGLLTLSDGHVAGQGYHIDVTTDPEGAGCSGKGTSQDDPAVKAACAVTLTIHENKPR